MFKEYSPNHGYDEYFSASDQPRDALRPLLSSLGQMGLDQLNHNHTAAGMLLKRLGATFRLNDSGNKGVERILPFDPLPRLISNREWQRLERGLMQRLEAIDLFLGDVYGPGKIEAGWRPTRKHVILPDGQLPRCRGSSLPWAPAPAPPGPDLVRDGAGTWWVLQVQPALPLRCRLLPREQTRHEAHVPQFFAWTVDPSTITPPSCSIPCGSWPPGRTCPPWWCSPPGVQQRLFEHSYLAQQMGIQLVEGRDRICENDRIWMRSTGGLEPVDVILTAASTTTSSICKFSAVIPCSACPA